MKKMVISGGVERIIATVVIVGLTVIGICAAMVKISGSGKDLTATSVDTLQHMQGGSMNVTNNRVD